jgi:hypothetical protein
MVRRAESEVIAQLRRAQEEINWRLDRLLAAQQETNELLGQLLSAVEPPARPAAKARPRSGQ